MLNLFFGETGVKVITRLSVNRPPNINLKKENCDAYNQLQNNSDFFIF